MNNKDLILAKIKKSEELLDEDTNEIYYSDDNDFKEICKYLLENQEKNYEFNIDKLNNNKFSPDFIKYLKKNTKIDDVKYIYLESLKTEKGLKLLELYKFDNLYLEVLIKENKIFLLKNIYKELQNIKNEEIKINLIINGIYEKIINYFLSDIFYNTLIKNENTEIQNKIHIDLLADFYKDKKNNKSEKIKINIDKKIFLKFLKKIKYKNINNKNFKIIEKTITEQKASSTLFCGLRGTGKTTFINHIINKIEDDNNYILIKSIINSGDIDFKNNNSINKDLLLRKLVRSFYNTITSNNNSIGYFQKQKLKKIFVETFYKIDEFEGNLKIVNNLSFIKNILFFFNSALIPILSGLIGFSLSIIFYTIKDKGLNYIFNIINDKGLISLIQNFIFNLKINEYIFSTKILLIIFFSILSYILFKTIININFYSKISSKIIDREILEYNISTFFNSFNKNFIRNMIINFYLLIKGNIDFYLYRKKIKTIIVFDEMDKLFDKINLIDDKKEKSKNIDVLFNMIGTLKYMFFENNLHFIFIFGKDIYDFYKENANVDDDIFTNIFTNIIYHPITSPSNIFVNDFIEKSEDLYIKNYCNYRYLNNYIFNYNNETIESVKFQSYIKDLFDKKIQFLNDINNNFLDKLNNYAKLDIFKDINYFSILTNYDILGKRIGGIEKHLKIDLSYRDYIIVKLLKVNDYIFRQNGGIINFKEMIVYFNNGDEKLKANLYKNWYIDFIIILLIYFLRYDEDILNTSNEYINFNKI